MSGAEDLHAVHLLQIPIAEHRRSSEHLEGLAREFALIHQSDPAQSSMPLRLRSLVEGLYAQFPGLGEQENAQLRAAGDRGERSIDLTYRVPAAWADACVVILQMLDEVDEFCRSGQLLTMAAAPDLVAFRRWVFGEFIRQVQGEEPRSWPAYLTAHPTS